MLNGAHGCFPVTGHFYSPAKTYLCWIDLVTFLSFALVSHLVDTSLVCNLVQILSGYRCTLSTTAARATSGCLLGRLAKVGEAHRAAAKRALGGVGQKRGWRMRRELTGELMSRAEE